MRWLVSKCGSKADSLKEAIPGIELDAGCGRTGACVPEPTAIPAASAVFVVFRGVDDCRINGNTSKLHLHPALRADRDVAMRVMRVMRVARRERQRSGATGFNNLAVQQPRCRVPEPAHRL